jgi:hypothetical protein
MATKYRLAELVPSLLRTSYWFLLMQNFRGEMDVDWMSGTGHTFTFTADTSKTDMDKPPVAGIAVFAVSASLG